MMNKLNSGNMNTVYNDLESASVGIFNQVSQVPKRTSTLTEDLEFIQNEIGNTEYRLNKHTGKICTFKEFIDESGTGFYQPCLGELLHTAIDNWKDSTKVIVESEEHLEELRRRMDYIFHGARDSNRTYPTYPGTLGTDTVTYWNGTYGNANNVITTSLNTSSSNGEV